MAQSQEAHCTIASQQGLFHAQKWGAKKQWDEKNAIKSGHEDVVDDGEIDPRFEIFPIVAANRPVSLAPSQMDKLAPQSRWLHQAAQADIKTLPTLVVTRAAWFALQNPRSPHFHRLVDHFANGLLALVENTSIHPHLVVMGQSLSPMRTHRMPLTDISPPHTPEDAVDIRQPLARAVQECFASFSDVNPNMDVHHTHSGIKDLVLIQPYVAHLLAQVQYRDPENGAPDARFLTNTRALDEDWLDKMRRLDGIVGSAATYMFTSDNATTARLVHIKSLNSRFSAELGAAMSRVEQGVWRHDQAIRALDANKLVQLIHPRLCDVPHTKALAKGMYVAPGAAVGQIALSVERVLEWREKGMTAILICQETGPADIAGMKASGGIVTMRGGITSHAGVIARVTGKPCITGPTDTLIHAKKGEVHFGNKILREGDVVTIDGESGQIHAGALALDSNIMPEGLSRILDWSDKYRDMTVRANAETVADAQAALTFGAQGVGLARTEHMLSTPERMLALRQMIFALTEKTRNIAIEQLSEFQMQDIADLFELMGDLPVCVRLFDPPLNEFAPRNAQELDDLVRSLELGGNSGGKDLARHIELLSEVNPMLGHRGCRLAITHPNILEMQIKACLKGAALGARRAGVSAKLEIMIPFVTSVREMRLMSDGVRSLIEKYRDELSQVQVKLGAMIELPRAALRAGDIAPFVDFFSFGTNDLTQTTLGISRDDSGAFLSEYARQGLMKNDPFVTLDRLGVGELIRIAVMRGRQSKPDLRIGICGEHAADPLSIEYLASLNVDYLSCSAYRLPTARLASSQIALQG